MLQIQGITRPNPLREDFGSFLERTVGTRQWVLAQRLTGSMKEKGYSVAIPPRKYAVLTLQWERNQFGAPLKKLEATAPEMYQVLLATLDALESGDSQRISVAEAVVRGILLKLNR